MKVNIVTRTNINASQSAVFKYLSDLKYHYLWNPQMLKISPVVQLSNGTTYKTENIILGVKVNSTNEVVKFTKNKEIELINETGQVHYRVNFLLQSQNGKTQLVCTTKVSTDSSYFSFAKPVLKLLAQRELQADMQALKLAVENKLV